MKLLSIFFVTLLSSPAWAFYSVLDNGEILKKGDYKLTETAQFITDTGGANLATRFDMGLTEDIGGRAIFGFGKTDVFFGGMARWMPIKEEGNQPTIGGSAGIIYGKDGGTRDIIFRVEPLVTKRFDVGEAIFSPYASIPMNFRSRDTDDDSDDTDEMAWQIVIGSQLQVVEWKNLQFIGEVGLDIDDAPAFVSLGAILYFDAENGVVFE